MRETLLKHPLLCSSFPHTGRLKVHDCIRRAVHDTRWEINPVGRDQRLCRLRRRIQRSLLIRLTKADVCEVLRSARLEDLLLGVFH